MSLGIEEITFKNVNVKDYKNILLSRILKFTAFFQIFLPSPYS